jgi:FtsZ-binding cell division protein ZapB
MRITMNDREMILEVLSTLEHKVNNILKTIEEHDNKLNTLKDSVDDIFEEIDKSVVDQLILIEEMLNQRLEEYGDRIKKLETKLNN